MNEMEFNRTREKLRELSTPVAELEAQRAKLDADIAAAHTVETARLAELEAERARAARVAAKEKLPDVLKGALESRAEFLRAYKAACIALGSYCRSWEQAEALTNALSVPLIGVSTEDREKLSISALAGPGDVLNAIRDSGYQPTASHGWNLSYPVVPFNRKGEPTQ